MSLVGLSTGGAGPADDGVAMDADEAAGWADAMALGPVFQDRDGGRFGEMAAIQGRAFALGEARAAGVAVEEPELVALAVVAAHREVADMALAIPGTVGVLAAEACEVVPGAKGPGARERVANRGGMGEPGLRLRSIPWNRSICLGHHRKMNRHLFPS